MGKGGHVRVKCRREGESTSEGGRREEGDREQGRETAGRHSAGRRLSSRTFKEWPIV